MVIKYEMSKFEIIMNTACVEFKAYVEIGDEKVLIPAKNYGASYSPVELEKAKAELPENIYAAYQAYCTPAIIEDYNRNTDKQWIEAD